jgi:hypothetical protein
MNIVGEDNRSQPQGRVVIPVDEDKRPTSSASEGLHMYGVSTLSGLRSSDAAKENGLELEIQQRYDVYMWSFL